MNIKLLMLFQFFLFCFCEISIVPKQVVVYEGDSYTFYINSTEKLTVESCTAQNQKDGVRYKIDVKKVNQKAQVVKNPQNIIATLDVRSLGNGICGFKVIKTPLYLTITKWVLSMTDKSKETYSETAELVTYSKQGLDLKNETIEIASGESLSIFCAEEQSYSNVEYCEIFWPNGQLAVKAAPRSGSRCSFTLDLPSADIFGTWTCKKSVRYLMEPQIKYFIVKKIERNVIETWVKETETEVSIGCNLTKSVDFQEHCAMVRPDGVRLLIRDGLGSDRYSSIGTQWEKTDTVKCSLQIVKPLKYYEYGTWSCEIGQKFSTLTNPFRFTLSGGFIHIKKNDIDVIPGPKIPKLYLTKLNDSLTMECKVFYSSPYCYFRSPNGTLYPVENDRSTTLGYCSFTKDLIQLSDNGTWTCGFANNNGTIDDTFTFKVHVEQARDIQPTSQEVSVRKGSSTTLMCTTKGLGNQPLKYCRFLSPNGKMYHLSAQAKNSSNVTERLHYDGRGIDFGDCGIRITKVEASDAGIWSCVTRLGINYQHSEIYDNILLNIDESENLTTASVIGIAIGVLIIFWGAVFLIYKKYKNRLCYSSSDVSVQYSIDDELTPTIEPSHSVNIINYTSDHQSIGGSRRRSGRGSPGTCN